jgi:UDP-N-acetylmuramyl pentapeptide phosphotransferase/UDP-N-acetylglucosamine-1-phosphate transferase
MAVFLIIIFTLLITIIDFSLIINFLRDAGLTTENYKGQLIPQGYGLLFGINLIIISIGGTLVGIYDFDLTTKLIILLLTMTLIGIIDDTLGYKEFQGFKGHLQALFDKHKLTTGLLKMIFSFIVVFYLFFYWYSSFLSSVVATFVVLLAANFINLLDFRPGRALKAFIFCLLLLIIYLKEEILVLALPSLIITLFSLPFDLKQKAMMGDVGSNLLGALLGFLFILKFPFDLQIVALIGLIVINFYSEFYSLTKLIENNRILNFIDQLGVD